MEPEQLQYKRIAFKAPANALVLKKMATLLPNSKFIFIIRDPRDTYNSHLRGNQEWMTKGKNSTIDGCMDAKQKYFESYLKAANLPNIHLIKYEDLHQNFPEIFKEICKFTDLFCNEKILRNCLINSSFQALTGRDHKENPNVGPRKGVVGDWANHLSEVDREWFKSNIFWKNYFNEFDYRWDIPSFSSLIKWMKNANIKADDWSNPDTNDQASFKVVHVLEGLEKDSNTEKLLTAITSDRNLSINGCYAFPIGIGREHNEKLIKLAEIINSQTPESPLALFVPHDKKDNSEQRKTECHNEIERYKSLGIELNHIIIRPVLSTSKEDMENLNKCLASAELPELVILEEKQLEEKHGTLKSFALPKTVDIRKLETFTGLSLNGLTIITNPLLYPADQPYCLAYRTEFA